MSGREGKHSTRKSEARVGTQVREGRVAIRAFRDEALCQSQVNFGPPNPTTDEKALLSKGKYVRCHTPCLPKVPRGRLDSVEQRLLENPLIAPKQLATRKRFFN